jgi:hypothetical protein
LNNIASTTIELASPTSSAVLIEQYYVNLLPQHYLQSQLFWFEQYRIDSNCSFHQCNCFIYATLTVVTTSEIVSIIYQQWSSSSTSTSMNNIASAAIKLGSPTLSSFLI